MLSTKLILFDLDNTLFNHYHSMYCAISAIQQHYPGLRNIPLQKLCHHYNDCLQKSYDRYLQKLISYEDKDIEKLKILFESLNLPEPTPQDVDAFRTIYQPVYRSSRRATSGSIETLTRLRERGFSIAILTNGQIEDQSAKAKAIGVHHLVDRIITSEEAGCPKPDRRIFRYAVDQLGGAFDKTYMVGDSPKYDIQGALDAHLTPILYSPLSQETSQAINGQTVPVITHMSQLLGHLDITTRE
ncbi:had-superfamily subfamily variant 1 [Fusarium longipes]|uniref:Had-superfamily subfamily variant 1 n=1 Tax=Fusarium longipes TaxID=694270 RepID=A0A395T534_9HYPO|nr:had-superfamily subfamily variant 1 [Fusarium longipes]